MNEITETAPQSIKQSENTAGRIGIAKRLLDTTQNMTTQQAAVTVSGIVVVGFDLAWLGYLAYNLIINGHIKEVDLSGKKVTFNACPGIKAA